MNDNASPQFSKEGENGISIASDDERIDSSKSEETAAPQPVAPKKKRSKILPVLAFLLVGGLLAFAVTQLDFSSISDTLSGMSYNASEEMSKLIDELELTDEGMRILKATHPELQEADAFNQSCPQSDKTSSILGCFYNNRIYVYNITSFELATIRQSTIAHELLHAVWERLSLSERNRLVPMLEEVLSQHDSLADHLQSYSENEHDSELHSIVGTQIKASEMPADLAAHYAKYFRNQDMIAGLFTSYYSVFEELESKSTELKEKIDEYRLEYDRQVADYNSKNDQLMKDIDLFNINATSGYYTSLEQFSADRESIIRRQEDMKDSYSRLSQTLSELNNLVHEYNSIAIHANGLNDIINSNVAQPAE